MIWPADIAVAPPRMKGRQRAAPIGTEEDQLCGRSYPGVAFCSGRLENRPPADGGCACHIAPPCGYCTSYTPECPVCGHREPEAS